MRKFIYPLTWEEFESLHREAWHNGWTYGPAYPELYEDYLVNWVYFVDYVDVLIKARNKSHKRQYERTGADIVHIPLENGQVLLRHVPEAYEDAFKLLSNEEAKTGPLKIFIGEAPPKWNWKELPSERTYFYHPLHTGPSDWFKVPKKIFKVSNPNKPEALYELALNQFLLLDIFPFPIIQDTEIRKEVTGEFSGFLDTYFKKKYQNILEYIFKNSFEELQNKEKIQHAIAMPLYGTLQITFGPNSRKKMDELGIFKEGIEINNLSKNKWCIKDQRTQKTYSLTIVKQIRKNGKLIETDRFKFIKKLLEFAGTDVDENTVNDWLGYNTPNIPLLCSDNGGLSSDNYINSKKNNQSN